MKADFIFKYRKHFAILRIILGILYLYYPLNEFILKDKKLPEGQEQWIIVVFFFLLYTISAINNGIKEFKGDLPSFNLLRFFEVSMNGLIALYLLIIIFAVKLAPAIIFFLLILDALIIIGFVRDLRILSIQYYDKRRKMKDK
jgi:hypothetical protein